MNGKTIAYWATTGLFSFALGASGIMYLTGQMTEPLMALGYTAPHFVYVLGTWKVLGVIALLTPGFPRIKEWAYAGFVFNLTGAAIAHIDAGDGMWAPPLVLLGLLIASYLLRPEANVLGSSDAEMRPATA